MRKQAKAEEEKRNGGAEIIVRDSEKISENGED